MKDFTLLHITNDYAGSQVYSHLIQKLDLLGIKQIVYSPVKTEKSIGKNEISFHVKGSKIIYSNILNLTTDRMFYRLKIKKIVNDLIHKIDCEKIDFIHAHTWYSDGGVAYQLNQKYGIPYIITVRNSDINVFYKFLIHERAIGRKILRNSNRIILISASYKERMQKLRALSPIRDKINEKLMVIPNGVDSFWIERSRSTNTPFKKDTFHVLYIGKFIKSKNLVPLQEAVILLNKEGIETKLHIVGGGGGASETVNKIIKKFPELFEYHGKVYDKQNLLEIIRACDIFAMPSRYETFGLVYVEAMLQGLPILYTKGEGIDGFYSETIGEKVASFTSEEIKSKLKSMILNYDSYKIPTKKIKQNHDWSRIAKEYQKIYTTKSPLPFEASSRK